MRRSETACAPRPAVAMGGWAEVPAALASSGAAHSEQNLALGGFAKPHCGQAPTNGAAHSLQNFAPTRFSLPQLGQINASRPQMLLGPERIPGGLAASVANEVAPRRSKISCAEVWLSPCPARSQRSRWHRAS